MKIFTHFIIAVAFSGAASLAYSIPILQISGGQLTGATEILFMGSNYDIAFSSNSCSDEYDGCNDADDFIFNDVTVVASFADTLLATVFQDGPLGNFDTDYNLTSGCGLGTSGFCNTSIPYAPDPDFGGTVRTVAVQNYAIEASDDTTGTGLVRVFLNGSFGNTPNATLGVIALSSNQPNGPGPVPVPAPATLALFGLGLAGLGWSRRKKA